MIYCSYTVIILRQINVVYQRAETYPDFVPFYAEKEIVHSDSSSTRVRMAAHFFGLKFRWEGEGMKLINEKISWVQTKGLLKGLRVEWTFLCDNDRETHATFSAHYSSPIPCWEKIVAAVFIRRTLPRILSALKSACENRKE